MNLYFDVEQGHFYIPENKTKWEIEITEEEFENLMSKNLTSNWGGRRKCPKVFTEQGIYMLMTVLNGDLAIKQSKALIRTFKAMKDYIIENQNLIGEREYLQLSMQIFENIQTTIELRSDLNDVEDQMADVMITGLLKNPQLIMK
ncbi:MAG: ORF6N domain-containing protein [Lachnospiraceae bacterium]|nr:ORF6N domain-containing protein [Lachnospiraceae bacterium]